MAKLNTAAINTRRTHEGAVAHPITAVQALRRSVMSCMLWENEFYEDGQTIEQRISDLCQQVKPMELAAIATQARTDFKLRHVPLLLAANLAKREKGAIVSSTIDSVIQRADELAEFCAIVQHLNGKPLKKCLSAQMKKGLAKAFQKFNAYQLAKYNRDGQIKLRDVLFLAHAKPKDDAQAAVWKQLIDGKLPAPDTWEVALSSGADKAATFQRLMAENQLGGLAFLRNLRNMEHAGVPKAVIATYSKTVNLSRVLPFRFISAARAVPGWEDLCDDMLLRGTSQQVKLPGKTIVVVDVSGSMYGAPVSQKSDMNRALAASALAAIMRDLCDDARIYATAGSDYSRKHATQLVPARRGMALVDVIYGLCRPLGGGGIFLKQVMDFIHEKERTADRVVVITDEQDCGVDSDDSPLSARVIGNQNYLINVANNKNGIGYGKWTHIDGFSEAVIDFIREYEAVAHTD